jgi:murein DD-endopeptidase MepM/ murein hydrolase activator NlpD/lysophospholipase L1-like esterase
VSSTVVYPRPSGEGSLEIGPRWGVDRGDPDVIARNLVDANRRKKWTTTKSVDLESALTGIQIVDTIDGSSTLTLTFQDPTWRLVDSGFFDVNEDGRLDRIDIEYPDESDLWWRCTQIGINATRSGASIDMTLMELVAAKLLNKKGPKKVRRGKTNRAEFIKGLCDEIRPKPHFHCKELHKDQPQSGGDILYVGDELASGTGPYIASGLPRRNVTRNGGSGRTSGQALAVLKAKLQKHHRIVGFDVGTNDAVGTPAVLRANLEAAWDLVRPRRFVVATVIRAAGVDASALNTTIKDFAAKYDNVLLVPWAQQGSTYLGADGFHPTEAGYKFRGNLWVGTLGGEEASVSLLRPALDTAPASSPGGKGARRERRQGIHDKANVTIKGQRPISERQKRNVEIALGEADRLHAPKRACLAMLCAGIQESGFDDTLVDYDTGTHKGVFQSNQIPQHDTRQQAHYFLKGGRSFGAGGAIELARHSVFSAGEIAVKVEVSGEDSGKYSVWLGEAKKLYAAYGGIEGAGADGGLNTNAGDRSGHFETTPYNFEVKRSETYWDAMGGLADDVKWALFVDGDDVYYEKETVLIRQMPAAVIHRRDPAVVSFSANWDIRKIATEATLELACSPFEFRAGDVLQLEGFGPATSGSTANLPGRWLVSEINRDRYALTSQFTLKQPTKPGREPPNEHHWVDEGDEEGGGPGGGAFTNGAHKGSPVPNQKPHGATHETGGLPGYPAYDYMAPAGTPVVAPYSGRIRKLSGRDPSAGGPPGGPLGYSIYLAGNGNDYYMTHLDKVRVKVGDRVKQGHQIAQVADGPPSWSTPHCHMGTHKGPA